MVDAVISAAVRQLWRRASGRLSRSLSIRREEFDGRLLNAGVAGACGRNPITEIRTERADGTRNGALWQPHFHRRKSKSKRISARTMDTAADSAVLFQRAEICAQ